MARSLNTGNAYRQPVDSRRDMLINIAKWTGVAALAIGVGSYILVEASPESAQSIPIVRNYVGDKEETPPTSTSPPAPPPTALPNYNTVTALDHQTMYAMRNAQRDAQPQGGGFTMQINGITYAWPVGQAHREDYKIALPCDIDATSVEAVQAGKMPCHGDPEKDRGYTPQFNFAMDFMYRDTSKGETGPDAIVGEPVRAITDGVIYSVDPGSDNPDCTQIKLNSVDGYSYWYAHMEADPPVTAGQTVTAGQQIGAVGGAECASSNVAHLHFQRSVLGVTDASTSERDPGAIPIVSTLYAAISQ